MPIYPKISTLDPAAVASHLPGPLQWYGGAALQGLKELAGGDNPSSIMGVGMPMMAGELGGAVKGLAGAAPEAAPSATYAHYWPELGEHQYNVTGGPYHGSTVGAGRLNELGIPIPETPAPTPDLAPVGGEAAYNATQPQPRPSQDAVSAALDRYTNKMGMGQLRGSETGEATPEGMIGGGLAGGGILYGLKKAYDSLPNMNPFKTYHDLLTPDQK